VYLVIKLKNSLVYRRPAIANKAAQRWFISRAWWQDHGSTLGSTINNDASNEAIALIEMIDF